MLQFETLLLRQLQKQQNRDEFCDTVLHTQGVSVPVHSCVLSAFSPKLCCTLSTMPVCMAGQRRLIEVQAVDACTLLSLVSLLYSGQFHENREQVLSAAQTLGIELPQWQEEERHGGNVGRRKDREDAGQDIEKEVDAREWDDRMTRRTEEGSGGEEVKMRDSGTQTGCGKEMDEGGAQTDLACSEPQSIQTVFPIDQAACSNQELGRYKNIYDTSLTLQTIQPERRSTTCEVLAMVPDTGDCHTVSESPWTSQIYLYSLENSDHQPSTSVTPHPHNSLLDKAMVATAPGADDINDLRQFEGNIPGFISYFLASTDTQNTERRGQGCAMEGAKEPVVKRARARPTGGGSVREWVRCIGGGRGGRRQRCMERWGLGARLAWQGQGGGRVGRLLETRARGKNKMRAFQRQRGREAFTEAGEARGRGRGRGRPRKRVMTGTVAGSEGQNDHPRRRRPRGRPRVRPLPAASRSLSAMTPAEQNTVDPTELDLLHTENPIPAVRLEPIDELLDDIMSGLHFLPPTENQINQQSLMSSTASSGPPASKAMDPNSHPIKLTHSKQHLEGEFGDILDHFLRTFDQQVGCCSLDMGGETSQDKFDAGSDETDPSLDPLSNTSKTCTQLQPHNPHLHHQKPQASILHTSSTRVNPSVAEKANVQDGPIHGAEVKKLSTDQNIVQQFETRRLTRSQSMKRKLETALISLQNPVKRNCKEKQSVGTKTKRQKDKKGRFEACVNKSGVKKLDKNNKNGAKQPFKEERQKRASAREKQGGVKRCGRKKRSDENRSHRMDGFYERKKTPKEGRPGINSCGERKKKVGGARVKADCRANGFQVGQSSVTSQIGGSCIEIASSAMEKVRMLLQLQDEEEDEGTNESVGIHRVSVVGNGRSVDHEGVCGAEERRLPVENRLQGHLGETGEQEDERRIIDNGEFERQERINSTVGVSQRQDDEERMNDGARHEELVTEQCSTLSPLKLPSNAAFSAKEATNDSEATLSTTESSANLLNSRPSDVVSAIGAYLLQSEVVSPSTQSTVHKTADLTLEAGDAPRLVSAAPTSYTQLCQELLSPHTSTKDLQLLAGSSADEEDDVDVLAVSSPDSELPTVSTMILGLDLSTDEEEEVEEDVEIDILGLESD